MTTETRTTASRKGASYLNRAEGSVQVLAGPKEPDAGLVSLENLKAVMRVQHSHEDALIAEYGRQASAYVCMRTSTYWGPPREVEIVRPGNNTNSLSVPGYATELLGAEERFALEDKRPLDVGGIEVRSRALVRPWGSWWCEAFYRVRYVQGLPLEEIPGDIIAAVKRVATHFYENRVPVQAGSAVAVPLDVESILMGHRKHRA